MRNLKTVLLTGAIASVTACVTINVYFPAAAAEKAAAEFIDDVIGEAAKDEAAKPRDPPKLGQILRRLSPIGVAYAQADLDVESAQVQAIKARMAERFRAELEAHFATGALGFTKDGLVAVRDAAAVPLAARSAVTGAVADENRDRAAVYREIAVANGHPEWEGQIRDTFAQQWIDRAPAGWWVQDASGAWKQK